MMSFYKGVLFCVFLWDSFNDGLSNFAFEVGPSSFRCREIGTGRISTIHMVQ